MQPLRIAFRNVSRHLKRTLLLGGAIAFGFLVFTILNGFTGGLLETVEGNVANVLGGHIYVSGSEVSEQGSEITVIRDTAAIKDALHAIEDQVLSYNTRSSANSSLIFGSREETLNLVGVDFSQEQDFLDNLDFVAGTPQHFLDNETGILLPEDIIDKLGLEVGESILIKTTTINGQQNVVDAVVVGSLGSQEGFGVSVGYTHIAMLNSLLDMEPGQFQTLNIYVNDLGKLEATTDALYQELASRAEVEPRSTNGNGSRRNFARAFGFSRLSRVDENERWLGTKFSISNLDERTTGITALVGVMNNIALVIFLIIIGIIMVGIMNSYRMVMIERTAEIGTMRAMGVQKTGIRNIFVWEALFIALGGALVGLVVALLSMGGISLVDFGPSNFSFFLDQGHLQFTVTFIKILGNMFLLCAMSVVSVFLPAQAAANLRPAEALRAGY